MKPEARLVQRLGGEDLWNITFINYSPASSHFHLYVIDVWQDIREPQITLHEDNKTGIVSLPLSETLHFADENAAWYILETIDTRFRSLHPVHVSRAIIGPYENKYRVKPETVPALDIARTLIAEDPTTNILRFARQYAYAPNHRTVDEELRQIVAKENWRDEMIVCKGAYAPRVSQALLGRNVRIIEM